MSVGSAPEKAGILVNIYVQIYGVKFFLQRGSSAKMGKLAAAQATLAQTCAHPCWIH